MAPETRKLTDPLQKYGALLLLAAFQRMGIFQGSGEVYEPSALAAHLGIIPEYARLFPALLNLLVRAGFLELHNGEIRTTGEIADPELIVVLRDPSPDALVKDYPDLAAHAECLRSCLGAYPEILTGKKNHLEVLFPKGSLSLVEKIYKGNHFADSCNRLVGQIVSAYVAERLACDPSSQLRILEVGAGTGATSSFVLKAVAEHSRQLRYLYTDLSVAFLEHGRKCFGELYPFTEFRILDLEQPADTQDFATDDIDLIISSNALHATRNISQTLANLKPLLRTNGLLVINEVTATHDFATLVFGLTSGWWRFEDADLRLPDSPLLGAERWQRLLAEAGFRKVSCLSPPGVSGPHPEQLNILVGESDGRALTSNAPHKRKRAGMPSTGEPPTSALENRAVEAAGLRSTALDYVKGIFSDILRIPKKRIADHSTFEKYGVDSLVVLEINKRFEEDFGDLPSTLLFEHNTIEALSAYFVHHHRETLTRKFSLDRSTVITLGSTSQPTAPATRQDLGQPATARVAVDEIAIIGLAGRYPLADTIEEFWENVRTGRNCIRPFPAERFGGRRDQVEDQTLLKWWGGFLNDIDRFDPLLFGISPAEAERIDPQERLFLETCWHVLEDAGYTRQSLERLQQSPAPGIGVFVGCMYQQYALVANEPDYGELLTNSSYWSIANRVSYFFNLRGPSLAIDTACSSSLTAIHLACESLRGGECSAAIAGGVNLTLHPSKYRALAEVGMLGSHPESRSLGQGDGLLPGEGVGAVFLKPLARALADGDYVYGVIKGSAINHGGKTSGYRVPNPKAQADVIEAALRRAGVPARTISYVEVASNGSPLGDPIEIAGLAQAFERDTSRRQFCAIGSVKSNLGHLEAASGISQLTKALCQLRHRQLAPTINACPLNPNLNLSQTPFVLQTELADWQQPVDEQEGQTKSIPRRVAISSFGAGGANAHLIVEEFATTLAAPSPDRPELIVLSAQNRERLLELVAAMARFLDRCEKSPPASLLSPSLSDFAFTLQTGREAMDERLAVVVSSLPELRQRLAEMLTGSAEGIVCGNAAQSQEAIKELFDSTAGAAFVESVLAIRDLEKAARLWVSGVSMAWEGLHREASPRRIPLPTYPFARRRCWIGDGPVVPKTLRRGSNHPAFLHPLVHANTSTLAVQKYTTRLTGEEFFLHDHKVLGQLVLPAVAYLEMARAAGELATERPVKKITRVSWSSQLALPEEGVQEPRDVEIRLVKQDEGLDFEVTHRGQDQDEVTLARGSLSFLSLTNGAADEHSLTLQENPEGVRQRCQPLLEQAALYRLFAERGLALGASFQTIQTLYGNEEEALAELALDEKLRATSSAYLLHPALLDGALQTITGLKNGAEAGGLELPLWIDEIEILKPVSPRAFARARRTFRSGPGATGSRFDIDLWNENGETAAKIRGMYARPLAQAAVVSTRESQGGQALMTGNSQFAALEDRLVELAARLLKMNPEEIDRGKEFNTYGFDSTSITTFARTIADAEGIPITPADLFGFPSIITLARHLSTISAESKERGRQPHGANGIAPHISSVAPCAQELQMRAGLERSSPGNTPIAIIGMAGVLPQSCDLAAFWSHLEAGRDLITEVPPDRWDWRACYGDPMTEANKTRAKWGGFMPEVDRFDALFFGISPREAALMDPQQRIFLETVWKTIEDAGYRASDLSGSRTGLFVGVASSDYAELVRDTVDDIDSQISTGISHSILANRVSYLLNLRGPSQPVDTACSSSLVAIHQAVEAIQSGSCDLAIAGGVNVILSPTMAIGFSKAGMMSDTGRCKAFAKSADGYVRGEGVGAVLLKPLDRAIADGDSIHAVILSTAVNHGGRSASLTAPNPQAQADLLVRAWEKARIDPHTIGYFEAHGTGTVLGDPIEVNGLKGALARFGTAHTNGSGNGPRCGIGSVKSNIGHLETASGIAGLLKIVLAFRHQTIPASLHVDELNPYLKLEASPLEIVRERQPWPRRRDQLGREIPRRAGVSSFGFGGANAHLVLEEYEVLPSAEPETAQPQIVVFSAREQERLHEYARSFIAFLEQARNPVLPSLADLAFTLQNGREEMECRVAMVVSSLQELHAKLLDYVAGKQEIAQLYAGQVKDSLALGRASKGSNGDGLSYLTVKGQLDKIAARWVEGARVNWRLLYPAGSRRRVSLPSYPFARERHWLSSPSRSRGVPATHPLIDRQDKREATEQAARLVYHKSLRPDEPVVRDHVVAGAAILPGAASLEMAFAAAQQAGFTDASLSDLIWLEPIIPTDGPLDLRIVLNHNDEQLLFAVESEAQGKRVIHVRGEIRTGQLQTAGDSRCSIDELIGRCTNPQTRAEIYERFAAIGVRYGNYFQSIETLWRGDEEALARLTLPEAALPGHVGITLHPSLIDGALQAVAVLTIEHGLEGAGRPRPKLPFSVERIAVRRPVPSSAYAHIQRRTREQFDISILNDQGETCCQLLGITFRALRKEVERLLYIPRWVPQPADPPRTSLPAEINGRAVLIVSSESAGQLANLPDHSGLAKALSELHGQAERIDGASLDQWLGSRAVGQSHPLRRIYFLGGFDTESYRLDDLAALANCRDRGVLALFRLIKSLSDLGYAERPLDLRVVTNAIHLVRERDEVRPFYAGLLGLTKAIAKEFPQWSVSGIDVSLDQPEQPGKAMEALAAMIRDEPGDEQNRDVAVRQGQRYLRTIEPVQFLCPPAGNSGFRTKGVYLIVGGLGGIGLVVARHLAETKQARLILLGRHEPTPQQMAAIGEIEARGGEVLHVTADVTDIRSLQTALARARERFGKINGAIHAALVLRNEMIQRMSEADFLATLAPKVQGSATLYHVLKEEAVDFLAFFSSVISFSGSIGQGNYAAASTFEDAFARSIGQQTGMPVKVINWGYWGTIGVVATDRTRQLMAAQGIHSIDPRTGLQALEWTINEPSLDQVLAISARPAALMQMGVDLSQTLEIYPVEIPSVITEVTGGARRRLQDDNLLPSYRAEDELRHLGRVLLMAAWQEMGVFRSAGERYARESFGSQLGILAHHHPLFEALLDITMRAGYLVEDGRWLETTTGCEAPELKAELSDLPQRWKDLAADLPVIAAHLELLWRCGTSLPDVLRGRKSGPEILFPAGSTRLVEAIYQGNPVADHCNLLVADLVRKYISIRRQDDPGCAIHILEVGAGTGSTAAAVLPALDQTPGIHYHYTDISSAFFDQARQRFAERFPFIEFRQLDIEKEAEQQGFARASVDLIIASNVLHATRRILPTLGLIKRPLKRNGLLILNEITQAQEFGTLTFGLTSGWWLAEDRADRIESSPLLGVGAWQRLLEAAGFGQVTTLGIDQADAGAVAQQVFVSASDGLVVSESLRDLQASVSRAEPESQAQVAVPSIRGGEELDTDLRERAITHLRCELGRLLQLDPLKIATDTALERYGVDSLVTLEISKTLEKQFGHLAPAVILENPTVKALANYLLVHHRSAVERQLGTARAGASSPRPKTGDLPEELVPINAGGTHQPSFWVHGVPGFAQIFQALSSALGPDFPIYAFQARGIDGKKLPFMSLEEMAAHYVQCLERVQPLGPIVLGGYSLGGVIAFEMARQLREIGRTVSHLVMLDTYPKTAQVERVFSDLRDQDFNRVLLANLFLTNKNASSFRITAADLAGIPAHLQIGELVRLIRERGQINQSPDDLYNYLQGTMAVSNFTGEAFRRYIVRPYDASDVLFFRATAGFVVEDNDLKLPSVERFRSFDYLEPWREVIRTNLQVIDIHTDHFNLLSPVGLPTVCNFIKPLLLTAERAAAEVAGSL